MRQVCRRKRFTRERSWRIAQRSYKLLTETNTGLGPEDSDSIRWFFRVATRGEETISAGAVETHGSIADKQALPGCSTILVISWFPSAASAGARRRVVNSVFLY